MPFVVGSTVESTDSGSTDSGPGGSTTDVVTVDDGLDVIETSGESEAVVAVSSVDLECLEVA